ncbi:MAG TPA: NAD(P)/FAD-dependent oxidoreductase [Vicinamibacterales bacterium]|nr:NAD(P)/FAD-dependent oxidoreductase [Vicinamibacterales bacterium]
METIDVAIVGGGIIGLAAAHAVGSRRREVCVLEAYPRFGHATSTRNSGVIHAGIDYPAGSLKATLCVEGRDRLYSFCEARGVPYARCGKLVVACDEVEIRALERTRDRAFASGVEDVRLVECAFVRAREPHVRAVAALWSPSSGIVEQEALIRAMIDSAKGAGAHLLRAAPLVGAAARRDGIELSTPAERFVARVVVNAAGLHADEVSALIGGERYRIHPCRGEYTELSPGARALISGLVYSVAGASGHTFGVRRTTRGTVLVGPTVRYQEEKDDYERDRLPLDAFLEPTRRLIPSVQLSDLQPGGSGIRAKLRGSADPGFADFMIRRDGNVPRLVQAAGIDSPGLTASLAIGERVASLVEEALAG